MPKNNSTTTRVRSRSAIRRLEAKEEEEEVHSSDSDQDIDPFDVDRQPDGSDSEESATGMGDGKVLEEAAAAAASVTKPKKKKSPAEKRGRDEDGGVVSAYENPREQLMNQALENIMSVRRLCGVSISTKVTPSELNEEINKLVKEQNDLQKAKLDREEMSRTQLKIAKMSRPEAKEDEKKEEEFNPFGVTVGRTDRNQFSDLSILLLVYQMKGSSTESIINEFTRRWDDYLNLKHPGIRDLDSKDPLVLHHWLTLDVVYKLGVTLITLANLKDVKWIRQAKAHSVSLGGLLSAIAHSGKSTEGFKNFSYVLSIAQPQDKNKNSEDRYADDLNFSLIRTVEHYASLTTHKKLPPRPKEEDSQDRTKRPLTEDDKKFENLSAGNGNQGGGYRRRK